VKTFGIYLAFPPNADLRTEGLGHYLAGFLNAAKDRTDSRFVIACPGWMIKPLHEFFESAGIPPKAFEIISPKTAPGVPRPEEMEAKLLGDQINARKDISVWFAPAAFWPHFNEIKAPRLTCVPDIVVHEFPVAFSSVNDDRFPGAFKSLQRTIEGGDRFVTYSEDIKYRTLVDRYRIAPDAITVVPHGAKRLDDLIAVSGFPDDKAASDLFCRNLFRAALQKAIGTVNAFHFDSGDVDFLFYASQFRPNKNIISLLKTYEYLLRRRYIGHKLVLTGNPNNLPEIAQFIKGRNLQNDVLCLHGLSAQELAACYRLADLAVNPSLSEGGCPFTLTEALSVGTPAVMARLAVTEEVVTDRELQDLMLFDPYDWQDMAARIEWALKNRDVLLRQQLQLYERLAERSWTTVVGEYVAIMDGMSGGAARIEGSA
jgi:glycosyltransferase involved in cell wall biosynthesis